MSYELSDMGVTVNSAIDDNIATVSRLMTDPMRLTDLGAAIHYIVDGDDQ